MDYHIRKIDIRNKRQAMQEFARIGATLHGQTIMADKASWLALKVKGIKARAAQILKQEMLSRMGDVVTSRDSLIKLDGPTDVIILGTEKSIKSLIDKLKIQPFGLKKLAVELNDYLGFLKKTQVQKIIAIGSKRFDIEKEGALIMGILNITPDSFFDGGKYITPEAILSRIKEISAQGAHIIDIGGMSTRPGSKPVGLDEELSRVIWVVKHIKENFDILVSVDTYRAEVAEQAVKAGADIINDISGHTFDKRMRKIIAQHGVSAVIMHIKGTPENMQDNPVYEDAVEEVYDFLYAASNKAMEAGIKREKIIIDPGIGFGKGLEHNISILRAIADLTSMGYPLLIGASRKSFIGSLLGNVPVEERLSGSLSAAVWAYLNGASILRVHDVLQTVDAVRIARQLKNV